MIETTVRSGADEVADAAWQRVRDLATRLSQLEAAQVDGDDDDLVMKVAATRLRAARATARAQLADQIADELGRRRARED